MSGINAGTISAELVLKADSFFSGLNKADSETKSFQGKLDNFSKGATDLGKSLTTKLTAPIVGVGAAATLLGMNFDASMSEVQAISGATGADMVKLEGIARDLGATTKFSANDAADGLKYMSMAGWETNEMMAALPAVLDLAAASNTDLGVTSDIVTDALTGFGLQAEDAAGFADLLASASSNSNTNVELMGETFKYVAPLFGSLGYSAEDAALATGLMANAGIKGSQAGTTLRAAITNLVKPTDAAAAVMKELGIETTDADGEMKPFGETMVDLRDKFSGLTEEQKAQKAATLFGKEAMSGMLAIINASEEDFVKLTKATNDYDGAAKDMADTMQNNLKGSINNIKSALEESALKIYNAMLPSLEKLADKIQSAVDWFNNLDEGTQANIVKMGLFLGAVGPVLIFVGKLGTGISALTGFFGLFTGAAATAGGVAGAGALTVGLGGVIATVAPFVLAGGLAVAAVKGISNVLKEEVVPEVDLFADKIEYSGETMDEFGNIVGNTMDTTVTKISEGTKEAVQSYLDMEEGIRQSTEDLYYENTKITEEIKADMVSKYNEMTVSVREAVQERKENELGIQKELFNEISTLTRDEQQSILEKTGNHYDDLELKLDSYEKQIETIYTKASQEKRKLKDSEMREIDRIETEMKKLSVKTLSATEVESKVILERMKASDERITAEMAGERIKKLNKLRDDAIKAADETYNKTVASIIRQRDESGTITAKQADKMIADAERQRKGIVKEAEETRDRSVKTIMGMNKKLEGSVDTSSGKILTTWGKLKNWWNSWKPGSKSFNSTTTITENKISTSSHKGGPAINAHGTEFFGGGYTWVGEQGRELIKAPRGSQIVSNPKSESMMSIDYDKLALAFVDALEGANITANTYLDNELVSEKVSNKMEIRDKRRGY